MEDAQDQNVAIVDMIDDPMRPMGKNPDAIAIVGPGRPGLGMGSQQGEDAIEALHVPPHRVQSELLESPILNPLQIVAGRDGQPELMHPAGVP